MYYSLAAQRAAYDSGGYGRPEPLNAGPKQAASRPTAPTALTKRSRVASSGAGAHGARTRRNRSKHGRDRLRSDVSRQPGGTFNGQAGSLRAKEKLALVAAHGLPCGGVALSNVELAMGACNDW